MLLSFSEILLAQIGHPELKQVNAVKSSLGIDPVTNIEMFKYEFANAPVNYSLFCDVIEPEMVCLFIDLDYAPVV